jgi:glycosyltransferase involved in cell wall biosynthesis
VYNGEPFLAEALRSLRDQTFTDLEIIVSDNASTDRTREIVAEAAALDPRIRYLRHGTNRGGRWNCNYVVRRASGELFKLAAADDVLHPDFIKRCVAALDAHGSRAVLAYSRTQIIDESGTVTEDLDDSSLRGDALLAHGRIGEFLRAQAAHLVYGVYRTEVIRDTRLLVPVVGMDVVLLTEMACRGRFVLVEDQLFLQRRHHRQYSARGVSQVEFHAPGKDPRFDFPHTKVSIELVRGVLGSPIGALEKSRCVAAVLSSWTIPRWRGLASDVRRALTGR